MDEIEFRSAEHYIQYKNALLCGDSVKANQILRSDTALDAKKLSYNIENFNMQRWINEGYELCEVGVWAKFEQNPLLLDILKNTTPKIVAEASKDKLWGTGISIKDKDALNQTK